jgi:glycogen debranching enzyme
MRSVWSWDHCFNALASVSNKVLAYDQFLIPFHYLDPTGAVPDIMNNHNVTWGMVKPPIHGLTLQKLQDKGLTLTKSQVAECYVALEKWTNFWFQYMDDDKNGIPQYNHGNDSGWDNSTYFDMGYSVESPDLCAFLALQMECLSNLAQRLGKTKESAAWKSRSDKLIKEMIAYFWDGKKFISKRTIDKSYKEENKSLMRFLPIVLGERLPLNIRKAMLEDLKSNGNITAYGLASESPSSTLYEEDGYWRGPIWAPTTYLIVEGLMKVGEKELAKSIAIKFADLCAKSGFAENFNAVTGAPLRDSGYTWTASVFLLLAGEYSK